MYIGVNVVELSHTFPNAFYVSPINVDSIDTLHMILNIASDATVFTPAYHDFTTRMLYSPSIAALLTLCLLISQSYANPAAYVCQASCAVIVAARYVANGAIFGAVRAIRASPALLKCNTAFGTCQATCASVWVAHANGPTTLEQLEQQMGGMSLGSTANEDGGLDALMDGFAKMNIQRP